MANYPIPVFHFKVSWNNQDVGFSDVSGLSQEIQAIEYRDGLMSGDKLSLKVEGIRKGGNLVCKRGIVEKNNDLFNWFNNNGAPKVERRDLLITLLNDTGTPVMVWNAGILSANRVSFQGRVPGSPRNGD